jgi:hypothetical protein
LLSGGLLCTTNPVIRLAASVTARRVEKEGKMSLTDKQKDIIFKLRKLAAVVGMDSKWLCAVAFVESSLGMNQKSPTGCRGVFQMSSIAMKDLLIEMEKSNNDWADILCGTAFLMLLLDRHKTIEQATAHFCDPKDRDFYIDRVVQYMTDETTF